MGYVQVHASIQWSHLESFVFIVFSFGIVAETLFIIKTPSRYELSLLTPLYSNQNNCQNTFYLISLLISESLLRWTADQFTTGMPRAWMPGQNSIIYDSELFITIDNPEHSSKWVGKWTAVNKDWQSCIVSVQHDHLKIRFHLSVLLCILLSEC